MPAKRNDVIAFDREHDHASSPTGSTELVVGLRHEPSPQVEPRLVVAPLDTGTPGLLSLGLVGGTARGSTPPH